MHTCTLRIITHTHTNTVAVLRLKQRHVRGCSKHVQFITDMYIDCGANNRTTCVETEHVYRSYMKTRLAQGQLLHDMHTDDTTYNRGTCTCGVKAVTVCLPGLAGQSALESMSSQPLRPTHSLYLYHGCWLWRERVRERRRFRVCALGG